MQTSGPADILYQLVNSQVTPETSLAQIQQQVQAAGMAAGIPEHVVAEVLLRFESERALPTAAAPRLLVD